VVTKKNGFCISVLTLALLAGCSYFVSWDESVSGGIGRPMIDIQKTWGQPDRIDTLGDGNKEYKYHLKKLDPTCIHYWIVNPEGIIVDYHYEGRCRPIG
jgi:hypothetical protein